MRESDNDKSSVIIKNTATYNCKLFLIACDSAEKIGS